MAIEKPKYKLIKKAGKFEIREYAGYITAGVEVKIKNYKTATNIGFRLIADYIFGNNTKKNKVAMTAPVLQEKSNFYEKIAMTAPVTTSKTESKYKISFVMPKHFTLNTLPTPNNEEVILTQIPPFKAAVITFSGFVNEKIIDTKSGELIAWIKKEKLESQDSFQIARYDPPWTPWFIRRNEIMIKIYDCKNF